MGDFLLDLRAGKLGKRSKPITELFAVVTVFEMRHVSISLGTTDVPVVGDLLPFSCSVSGEVPFAIPMAIGRKGFKVAEASGTYTEHAESVFESILEIMASQGGW